MGLQAQWTKERIGPKGVVTVRREGGRGATRNARGPQALVRRGRRRTTNRGRKECVEGLGNQGPPRTNLGNEPTPPLEISGVGGVGGKLATNTRGCNKPTEIVKTLAQPWALRGGNFPPYNWLNHRIMIWP